MKNNKKMIIEILIIIGISIIMIYNFIVAKKDTEEFIYSDSSNNQEYNTNLQNTNENLDLTAEKIKVYIIGQIKTNGVIELEYGSRIEDAIIIAGGPTEIADLSKVNLAYQLEDGQKIYIPSIYDDDVQYISAGSGENIIEDNNNLENNKSKKVNINKSNLTELTSIPGIGESTAQKIIDYRNENGKFSSIEDLKKVSGIGDKKFEKIKEYIDIK